MRRAITLAIEAQNSGNGPFGAVVVQGIEIIAESQNSVRSKADCTQHAELSVIQKACTALGTKDLGNCILYTSCEPCMMCLGACYWAKFKTIYFGASAHDAKQFGYVYSELYYSSDESRRRNEFNMKQILRNEAIAIWNKN